jgi:hypothetical protein
MVFLTAALPAFARSKQDRVGIGTDITIADGESAGDIACAFCSVHVHGTVKGDVAVLFGSIYVDAGRSISGDVAALGADVHLGEGAWTGGDMAIAAGDLRLDPGAEVHGQRSIAPSRLWLILPFAPLLILGGIIWLIVYIVRRNRYQFPAYPHGRR